MGIPASVLGIVEVIDTSGGDIDTRIRLQKEAFLLASAGSNRFFVDDFQYHHYGPYSRKLSDALRFSVALGLVEETPHPIRNGASRYSYKLAQAGLNLLKENDSLSETQQGQIQFMGDKHWRALELAATIRFLELKEGIADRSTAIVEALKLKPETKSYIDEAKSVLMQF